MLLSIIIPVYNVEKYLEKCLDSILLQRIDKSYYEVICVDDCSTDKSLEVANGYANLYSNVKVLKNDVNSGASCARNLGVESASGQYFWFVDGDDCLADGALQVLVDLIKKENPDLIKINFTQFIDGEDCPTVKIEDVNYEWLEKCILDHTFTGVIKREVAKNNLNDGKFFEDITFGEDMLFWRGVFVNQRGATLYLKNPVYYYRTNRTSSVMESSIQADKMDIKFTDLIKSVEVLREWRNVAPTDKVEEIDFQIKIYLISAFAAVLYKSSYPTLKTLKKFYQDGFIDKDFYKEHKKRLKKMILKGRILKIIPPCFRKKIIKKK